MSQPLPPQLQAPNLGLMYDVTCRQHASLTAFATRQKDGSYETFSYATVHEQTQALATALIDLGVEAREHVGLLADNRLEWILADMAIIQAGAADVPRGSDVTAEEITYSLTHADCRVVFVEHQAMLKKVLQLRDKLQGIQHIVLMDLKAEAPEGVLSMAGLIEKGRALRASGDRRLEERLAGIMPGDLFTLIYTSGTTGTPKGVQLTHSAMMSQVRNLPIVVTPADRLLSILPVWHSFERVFQMVALSRGASTWYTTVRTIADDLVKVRPTMMGSAPRLWENLYTKITGKVKKAPPLQQKMFGWALTVAVRMLRARQELRGQSLDMVGHSLSHKAWRRLMATVEAGILLVPHLVLDRLVLAKLRAVMGGAFRGTVSGGGALQLHVDEFFNAIGIPVLEGYGMTETCPVLAVRTFENRVIGTVGPLWPETELRIIDLQDGKVLYPDAQHAHEGRGRKGEIHVRGPQVMKGYYKNPEATDKVLRDGWMNTGDIGMMTFNDCLKIMGRSKDTIVLLSGENIEPVPIENRLTQSPLIEQVMVVGQDEKHLAALVVASLDGLKAKGLDFKEHGAAASSPEVRKMVEAEAKALVNTENGFKAFEQVTAVRVLPKAFELGEEMTNTYKLRRHVIAEKYQALIDDIYGRGTSEG